MTKQSKELAEAFINGESLRIKKDFINGDSWTYHGNTIAYRIPNGNIVVTLAGWNTVSTRERLNTLLRALGHFGYFSQVDFEPYYKGKPCDSKEEFIVLAKECTKL